MCKLLLVGALVGLTSTPPFVDEAAAKRVCQLTAPHGECGIAVAAGRGAGSESAGKVNVQDLSGIFSAPNPPGKQIGGGGSAGG
jgi:hypothetical protein